MAVPVYDAPLVAWSTVVFTRLSPDPAIAGISVAQFDTFTAAQELFVLAADAMAEARAVGARSKALTEERDSKKDDLLKVARAMYGMIQANDEVSDTLKAELGIVVRSGTLTPAEPITVRPRTSILEAVVRDVTIGVWDEDTTGVRRRYPKAKCAWVYTYVGATYPSDAGQWQFMGAARETKFTFTLDDSVPAGATVWVMAAWVNTLELAGPPSVPVSTNVPGGGAGEQVAMKIAA